MTTPTASGVTLTRPSALDEVRRTLLGELFQPLGKLGIASVFGTSAGVGGAAVDLVSKFSPDESTEEAAWRLVWLALRDAVDDLADAARFSTTAKDSIDTGHLLQLGGKAVDLDRIAVPWTFLQRPSDLSVLEVIAGNLKAALVYLGTEEHAARAAAARLPARFGDFFYKRAMQYPTRLDQLRLLLRSEPAVALQQWRNWLAYGAHLQSELDAPLFAGPFSLRQLYQPLRGYWTERPNGAGQLHHAVDLTRDFDDWLETFDKSDVLRVVAGGPGSGKSSFIKCWASQVMQREAMVPTLLVPLHQLKTPDLEREIGDYAKLLGFPTNPLDIEAGERRLLLILDGLDELDVGGDAAAALVSWVRKLLLRNSNGFEICVVLTGRAPIIEGLRTELEQEGRIYHVLGYAPCKVDAQWKDPDWRLQVDQRQDWWQRWGELSGDGSTGMPAEIAGIENLANLADEPLLNHLLAIARKDDPAALDPSSSRNSVYARLLSCVWKRTWGEMGQVAAVKKLTVDEFDRLFESIGLAVWQKGPGRSTTLAEIAEVARAEKLDNKVLPVFREEAEKGARALLSAFFFRRAGSDETFELTHKTFGEYLAARRLARLIEELHDRLQSSDSDDREALRCWYRMTHAARITVDIVTFLEGELRARDVDEVHSWRKSLIRLFNWNLPRGLEHESLGEMKRPAHHREAQRFDAAAELALLAAIGASTTAIIDGTRDLQDDDERRKRVRWSPSWPDRGNAVRTSAWDLLRRLEAGTIGDTVARRAMQGLNLDEQIIRGDLSGARLTFASALRSQLRRANLFRADIRHTDLADADFMGANLSGVYLDGASLPRANLSGANLIGAGFRDADLTEANLRGSIISAVDLGEVEAFEPDYRGPDFSDAKLNRAKLDGADFRDATFANASLTHARVSGTNLGGAFLVGADLNGVDLHNVIGLTLLRLEGARNVDWTRVPPDLPEER